METIHLTHPETPEFVPSVMVLGFFDGVHIGHQAVIEHAKQRAEQLDVPVTVVTFDPHPKQVLSNNADAVRYITPLKRKLQRIAALGVERCLVLTFTKQLASLSPQQFVDDYLIGAGAVHVTAGFDYSYGKFGEGTMETMPYHARGRFTTSVVAEQTSDGDKVSSTRIRKLLGAGSVDLASELLGAPYVICGEVIHGDARGRTIGYPTANMVMDASYVMPRLGVYATRVRLEDGRTFDAMTNVGRRPTFYDTGDVSIESHLFDFSEDLYGQLLEIEWVHYLRDERAFDGLDSLIAQLKRDETAARAILS
ncbi:MULTISPECIES: bifunctional riboflavin kinase/FAD synthetase [unclassified Exiguobacterium]|uniref:bifunctional riboflavin kinase/FAD synthetase n=1 Tax=unclassified Exiguobacterium TaxID=2644629 RepID=UPI00103B9991|nr:MULTISPECIES: bifunctional riboflavin kinase/FAD synthetase [unclassified Exiguobacterium]TCI37312.1 bifunctional riboflavin kinase/FAD synthetase [Exiguobacterium sp. SH4S7]TCI45442.1 bifunctional riboflavin kinase/FAD synthetase [Exiguobacterium sp. SH5S32]TCI52643.1 bifunctional riboflavin kinase/FAD synthetase [Exiguobacterium sp. SH1S4]TCI70832.1 bifunctional riboflavin kinase/FAD synthetase [Exiguobacterium sp. SH1S1]